MTCEGSSENRVGFCVRAGVAMNGVEAVVREAALAFVKGVVAFFEFAKEFIYSRYRCSLLGREGIEPVLKKLRPVNGEGFVGSKSGENLGWVIAAVEPTSCQ